MGLSLVWLKWRDECGSELAEFVSHSARDTAVRPSGPSVKTRHSRQSSGNYETMTIDPINDRSLVERKRHAMSFVDRKFIVLTKHTN